MTLSDDDIAVQLDEDVHPITLTPVFEWILGSKV
jgi:hypothetical protein